MKTTPRTGRSASARTARTWPTISCASRLREKPRRPVAQKAQASAQPAWLEMQTTYFFSLPAYALRSAPGASHGTGMRTASTCAPPSSSKRYLRNPSAAVWRPRTRRGAALVADSIASRTARRTPRTDRKSCSPRRTAAASSLRPTSSVTPSDPYCSGSIPQRCITTADLLEVERDLQPIELDRAGRGRGHRRSEAGHQHEIDVAVRLDEVQRILRRREDVARDRWISQELPRRSVPPIQGVGREVAEDETGRERPRRGDRHRCVRDLAARADARRGLDEQSRSRLPAQRPDVVGERVAHCASEEECARGGRVERSSVRRRPSHDCLGSSRGSDRGGGGLEGRLPPRIASGRRSGRGEVQLPDVRLYSGRVGSAVDGQLARIRKPHYRPRPRARPRGRRDRKS